MDSRRTCRVPGLLLGLAFVLALCPPFQVQADSNEGGFTGVIEAHRVVMRDGGEEQLLPADRVRPNDIIEYKLIYKNTSSRALRNIVITDPVPSAAVYIDGSAVLPQSGRIQFSIDRGESFHAWPVKVRVETSDGEVVWKDAAPEQVTHIRWALDEAVDPDQNVIVGYRASVK